MRDPAESQSSSRASERICIVYETHRHRGYAPSGAITVQRVCRMPQKHDRICPQGAHERSQHCARDALLNVNCSWWAEAVVANVLSVGSR